MSTRISHWSLRLKPQDVCFAATAATGKCKFSAYADDLLLLVEGNSRRQLEEKSAELMQTAADWGRRIGVEVSVDKTVMMLMKGSLLHTRTPSVRYGAHAVKYVTEVKYLGMTQFVSVLTSTIICSH